jgi:membrane peptidoglycan carboxypeptidase
MVELQAYQTIGQSWNALGYPFETLTPSYAAAIGASGDRPAALAELIGVVAAGGTKLPTESLSELEFGEHTPYETQFKRLPSAEHPQLSPQIVAVVHRLLRDVVLGGTGQRLSDGMRLPDGQIFEVYGKTGTGDQRYNVFARGAHLVESRKVNRSATFVFGIGDRFFGTLTVYVHEPYAAHYDFTSALSVQLLKSLAPALQPLFGKVAA